MFSISKNVQTMLEWLYPPPDPFPIFVLFVLFFMDEVFLVTIFYSIFYLSTCYTILSLNIFIFFMKIEKSKENRKIKRKSKNQKKIEKKINAKNVN
jgi:hypothetical protein